MVPIPQTLIEGLSSATDTRALEIGRGILGLTAAVFRAQFGGRAAVIVADTNTFAAAGREVWDAFRRAGQPVLEPYLFDTAPLQADWPHVTALTAALEIHDAIPIAVGSGTVNDLTKLSSHLVGRRYLAVATAASMDGYTAFGASITRDGSKQTFDCPAPLAVMADLNVLCAAPPALNAAGYADLLAKVTAGADWILADALGVETIDPLTWALAQGSLKVALARPEGVRTGEMEAVRALTEGLMLGGFAMQRSRSSRPASGAEHQFSHLWDMQHQTHHGVAPSHGFKVGIGTLAVSRLYEHLLDQPLHALNVEACVTAYRAWPEQERIIYDLFPEPELRDKALTESRAKHLDADGFRARLHLVRSEWPALRPRLRAQLRASKELSALLQAAGAPHLPEQISISPARLRDSHRLAYHIRRRFTVLDLAVETGLLDRSLGVS